MRERATESKAVGRRFWWLAEHKSRTTIEQRIGGLGGALDRSCLFNERARECES